LCPSVSAVNPASPAFLGYGPVTFQVTGAPAEAVSSSLVLFDVTLPEWGGVGVLDLDPYNIYPSLPTFSWLGDLLSFPGIKGILPTVVTALVDLTPAHPGTYNWLMVFYDQFGNPICR